MNTLLKSALWYRREKGYSVIPVKQNKKPYVKWESFAKKPPSEKVIKQWWSDFPNANVGICTGKVSGITAIDSDSEQSDNLLNEYLPDSYITPTVKTPKGKHLICKYMKEFSNAVRLVSDIDIRNDGGYVVAPPSKTPNGNYKWLVRIDKQDPAVLPGVLKDILLQSYNSTSVLSSSICETVGNSGNLMTTLDNFFSEGHRDESLFHLANYLVKSGMPYANIEKYLLFFASNCTPPFSSAEAREKIHSALKRDEARSRNLSEEVRNELKLTRGSIKTTDLCQELSLSSKTEKRNLSKILGRLCEDGVLEREKYGFFRKIDDTCIAENWQGAETNTVKLWLPFDLDDIVEVMPGDIILIMGSQNAGKSALQMNIAKENRFDWNVHYFSSELRVGGFKRRMQKFPEVNIKNMKINFYRRGEDFADVIKIGGGNLNVIDYVELHDNFYKISGILAGIHDKLDGAVCIAAIQKDPHQLFGRGGSFTQEKPVLSLSLDNGIATIAKCKEWKEGLDNPNRMQYRFKLVEGCRIIREQGWHVPLEEG